MNVLLWANIKVFSYPDSMNVNSLKFITGYLGRSDNNNTKKEEKKAKNGRWGERAKVISSPPLHGQMGIMRII